MSNRDSRDTSAVSALPALGSEPESALTTAADQNYRLSDGTTITINGEPRRVQIIPESSTTFAAPADLVAVDAVAYRAAIAVLSRCAESVQDISDRLLDSRDGATVQGARLIADNLAYLSEESSRPIAAYALALIKNGGTLDTESRSIIIPPLARRDLEAELARLPEETRQNFDLKEWLDHAYDAVPDITQGYYLFSTPANREIFRDNLPGAQPKMFELSEIFYRCCEQGGQIAATDRARYLALSRELIELQGAALDEQIAASPNVAAVTDPCTRVRIEVELVSTEANATRPEVKLHFTTADYAREFAPELTRISGDLLTARSLLPAQADELRQVLGEQSQWCIDRAPSATWGKSLPSWVAAHDLGQLLDVNITCEESSSLLGGKNNIQLIVAQHAAQDSALQSALAKIANAGTDSASDLAQVHTLSLRVLLAAGHMFHHTPSGERLPVIEGEPIYKVMTFSNTTAAIAVESAREIVRSVTARDSDLQKDLVPAALSAVTLAQYASTQTAPNSDLGRLSRPLNEALIQASTLSLAAKLAPDQFREIAALECCVRPIEAVRLGMIRFAPSPADQRGELILIADLLQAQALKIRAASARTALTIADLPLVADIAFEQMVKLRLWEIGIPAGYQASFAREASQEDVGSIARMAESAVQFLRIADDVLKRRLRDDVRKEVSAYFSPSRMSEISELLSPIARAIGSPRPLIILPADMRLKGLLVQRNPG